ncbi:acyl-CoA dehydrogenase family protein [Oceanicoccus sp. KOV_DT_Chl]|uniref:acyl-CoA dehydrogenase family protein n=1 Tax=Oceanicoccus sp. KOV_DT_Chl TaxID=1904639 RepID=UPI0013580EF0|nr:acyl-CoA dehydrogenase family protein [Oceanicoccus sp. KOV_DT_Chl]
MNFSYSEEQLDVIKLAQQILGDQTSNEQLKLIDQQADRFDNKLWSDLAEAGLLGVAIDTAYGGMGFGFETLCLLIEEVGRTVAPVPVIPVLVSSAASLQRFADTTVNQHWLPLIANGTAMLTSALIEAGNENSLAPTTTAADANGQWLLTGSKHCVPFAEQAQGILLSARTEQGLGVFLLERNPNTSTLQRQHVTAGEPQYQLQLDQAPATLIAQGQQAETMMQWMVEATTAAYAMMAVGVCDRMLRMTASYTSERQQFGVQIATFQAVGHRAADCFIDVECLRLVTQQAVSLINQDLKATEAVIVAKIWTGDVCHRVSQAAQHLHGGIGVDRDYPLWRYCLWARQIELSCGTSAALLDKLGQRIARQFLPPAA